MAQRTEVRTVASPPESRRERLVGDVADLREDLRAADQKFRIAVRERPLAALAIAVAAGYVAGRIISRA